MHHRGMFSSTLKVGEAYSASSLLVAKSANCQFCSVPRSFPGVPQQLTQSSPHFNRREWAAQGGFQALVCPLDLL